MMAEEIMKDLKEVKKDKLSRLDKDLEYQRVFEERMDDMNKEREGLAQRQKELTKENENLKVKFSQLLDQF
jgi:uncharacterized protein YllA (UPF0747 family)